MPETRSSARTRARRLGFPLSQVVKARTGGYFIAPRGVTRAKARRAYAECRSNGGKQSTCAAVAHNLNKRRKR